MLQDCTTQEQISVNFYLESYKSSYLQLDSYQIESTPTAITITAPNDRSILLGVYGLLRALGCRFPTPNKAFDFIPTITHEELSISIEETASYYHRGVCLEGSNSLENILDFIDWLPKLGFNSFFVQHLYPASFLKNWYYHTFNPKLPAEDLTEEQLHTMFQAIDSAIAKRGLLHHRVGHGWTNMAIGYDSTCETTQLAPTTQQEPLLALVNGERVFWEGVPSNTNLCYSNPSARKAFIHAIVDYAKKRPDIDYIHVWLADEFNNICECEHCQATTLSDQYVSLLNEIDEAFSRDQLTNKITMLLYQELLWPPTTEQLNNPERFTLMFAPISRTFEYSYAERGVSPSIEPYVRNKVTLPLTLEENLSFLEAWQQIHKGDSFVYDYPLGRAHYGDFGYAHIASIISKDIKTLKEIGLNGYMSCQELRISFPNSLPTYVMGHTLWNHNLDFSTLQDEYYRVLYGENHLLIQDYLTQLSAHAVCDYLNGKGKRKNADIAKKIEGGLQIIQDFTPKLVQLATTPAIEILQYHATYSTLLLKAMLAQANDELDLAGSYWEKFVDYVRTIEPNVQEVLDVYRVLEVTSKYTGFSLPGRIIQKPITY